MPMLASHFHDEISWQALTSPVLILAGLGVLAAAVTRFDRVARRFLVGVGIVVAVAGLYRVVELPALRHNHLCHAHHSDDVICTAEHAANRDDHTHWFGGRAARPRYADYWRS
jgi:hypothetical protein